MSEEIDCTLILENKGSLITYKDNGQDVCLGALWYAEGHGCNDPSHGRVDVTKEEAEIHNRCLAQALIDGAHCNLPGRPRGRSTPRSVRTKPTSL